MIQFNKKILKILDGQEALTKTFTKYDYVTVLIEDTSKPESLKQYESIMSPQEVRMRLKKQSLIDKVVSEKDIEELMVLVEDYVLHEEWSSNIE